ncbi:Dextranase [Fusarium oxysporum f. sp. cubense]|uniref:Dextranase n=1 Tax=Fusarium oxysporum f. sp. cubense TaxID=61366 RepID=A0A559LW45_FUSOC|nr:Dextranase [Fusarium oxysporum f. sp. cubense]
MVLPCWKFFGFLTAARLCEVKEPKSDVTTWWHDSSVINTNASVTADEVRRSRRYKVSISLAGEDDFHRSFVYESIPRNGNGKMFDPAQPEKEYDFADGDGITIEADEGISMAWTQFIYRKDVDVRIVTTDGSSIGPASNVVIRPVDLGFKVKSPKDNTVLIRVPFQKSGARFSVEFRDDLVTYRSNGTDYVNDGGVIVSEEPKNGLIIFASPPLPKDLVPSKTSSNVQVIHSGKVTQDTFGSKPTMIFESGIHWIEKDGIVGKDHIKLHPNTHYVYFEPGAYVKAALEYTTKHPTFHTVGYGVLSGENYVYMANTVKNYTSVKDDRYSLRMFWHQSVMDNQTWHCIGPTLNSPPFNTMDLYPMNSTPHEEDNKVSAYIRDYKQVGAYYFQTDGTQMYRGSVRDVFWHVNDDAIKLYHSGAQLHALTIWKARNNAIIQMGWKPRNVSDVSVSKLRIIHNRWIKANAYVPSAVLGASPFYGDPKEIDTQRTMQVKIDDVVCEGICAALMTIAPMQNFDLKMSNVRFQTLHKDAELGLGRSVVGMDAGEGMDNYTPGQGNLTLGIHITNWTIADKEVDKKNVGEDMLGQLKINPMFDGDWTIE